MGKLLRAAFLADYFVNASFRRELRRVLNRGEAVNALKRVIYTGRVTPAQTRRADEMQAVTDALSLLANIVMAWNTGEKRPLQGKKRLMLYRMFGELNGSSSRIRLP